MPLKEDKISKEFYEQNSAIEKAAEMLDPRHSGVICDKNGNLLYVNDRAKAKIIKEEISNIFSIISAPDKEHIMRILSESTREAYETKPFEYLLIFPTNDDLRGIIHMNLSPKNYEDLHSLLRASAQNLSVIERVMSQHSKTGNKLINTVSTRMTKIIQLLEFETLPPKPYAEITYDLTELTKRLCNYASCALEEFSGSITLDASAAVFSRINPELYVMLFATSASLVMCQSENTSLSLTLKPDEFDPGRCCIRFRSNGCTTASRMYTNFLEYALYKLGIDCSILSDKENQITELSMFIETETSFENRVNSDLLEISIYDITRYTEILSERLYTHI